MEQDTSVTADVNADPSASNDIDAQLSQMREAEKAPAQDSPAQDQPKAEEVKVKEEKVVPLAALHEERNERKRLQQELASQRQMMEKVNQRLEQLMTPRQQAPDPTQQPIEYLDHKIGQVSHQTQQLLEQQQRAQQEEQQRQYIGQLATRINAAEASFAQENKDYGDAVKYLDQARVRELMVFGVPQDQALAQAAQERIQAALQWAHSGQNPAQIAYEFAKARGYQPQAAQSQGVTPQDKIAAQQKGIQAAKSLGNGGATKGALTAQALAEMSDEEFAQLSESQWRKAMGG